MISRRPRAPSIREPGFCAEEATVPAALPTRDELHKQLTLARAALIVSEDAGDTLTAELMRLRVDQLLDRLLEQLHTSVTI